MADYDEGFCGMSPPSVGTVTVSQCRRCADMLSTTADFATRGTRGWFGPWQAVTAWSAETDLGVVFNTLVSRFMCSLPSPPLALCSLVWCVFSLRYFTLMDSSWWSMTRPALPPPAATGRWYVAELSWACAEQIILVPLWPADDRCRN